MWQEDRDATFNEGEENKEQIECFSWCSHNGLLLTATTAHNILAYDFLNSEQEV